MNVFQHILAFAIQLYRWTLSPLKDLLFGPAAKCRFQPSCSEYALEAVKMHGAVHGSWLGFRRLCRCHPWGAFGYDPVPPLHKHQKIDATTGALPAVAVR